MNISGYAKHIRFIEETMKECEKESLTIRGAGFILLQIYRKRLWREYEIGGCEALLEVLVEREGSGDHKKIKK